MIREVDKACCLEAVEDRSRGLLLLGGSAVEEKGKVDYLWLWLSRLDVVEVDGGVGLRGSLRV